MKKVMSLMLGLTLVLGATAVFAQDKPADTTTTTPKTKKAKKSKKSKKMDSTMSTDTTTKK